jgi:hypothetical protein
MLSCKTNTEYLLCKSSRGGGTGIPDQTLGCSGIAREQGGPPLVEVAIVKLMGDLPAAATAGSSSPAGGRARAETVQR